MLDPVAHAPCPSPELVWSRLTQGCDRVFRAGTVEGNQALRDGDKVLAGWLHEDSLHEAEALLSQGERSRAWLVGPMAYVVACQNLAATVEAGEPARAHAYRIQAVERLLRIVEQPSEALTLRINAARHMRHAMVFAMARSAPDEESAWAMEELFARCARSAATLTAAMEETTGRPS